MPELPEVEATRVHLTTWTVGRVITDLTRDDPALDPRLDTVLGGALTSWSRRGKALVATLSDGRRIYAHLGMTGRWVRDPAAGTRTRLTLAFAPTSSSPPSASSPSSPPSRSSAPPSTVAYADTRRLGTVRVLDPDDDPFAALGPDAWLDLAPDDPRALDRLTAALAPNSKATTPLKDRLLDQSRLAGLGNIAIIEAAFRAGLHPHTPLAALTPRDLLQLLHAIRAHLEATLADALATDFLTYVSEGGPNPFLVYGREGEPCPRCQTPITRALHAGRPTFTCPRCQPPRAKA